MTRILLPALLALAGLAAILWFTLAPQDGAAPDARIAQAVQDYAAREAEAGRADRDNRIKARWQALAHAPGSPVLGNPDGDVTIVVFTDYACAYCRAAEPRLMALAQNDGRLRIVMKEFPILTPESLTATRMALAAAQQGRYADFHAGLMQLPGQLNEADMEALARSLGLDMARLSRDMQGAAVSDEIIANFNLARGIRAFQTPTYIVNGRLLSQDSGDIDFAREVAYARSAR